MNAPKQDRRTKKRGAVTGAGIMTAMMLIVMAICLWAEWTDPIPVPLFVLFMLLPAAVIAGVWIAVKQRFSEIEGGEEDEAAQY